jgi:Fic family protein
MASSPCPKQEVSPIKYLAERSIMTTERYDIEGTLYSYSTSIQLQLSELSSRVRTLREKGSLSPEVLYRLRKYFKIKNIYHSNAIEGNLLNVGETEQVVELGLTLTGKSLKDQAEAKNLAEAVDFLEELAKDSTRPITENDIRQLHLVVLKGIDDENAGGYRKLKVEISGSKYKPKGPEAVPVEMRELGGC